METKHVVKHAKQVIVNKLNVFWKAWDILDLGQVFFNNISTNRSDEFVVRPASAVHSVDFLGEGILWIKIVTHSLFDQLDKWT